MKYIRACAICNMYFPPTSWLCELCWKAMEREYLSSEQAYRAEKTLPHLRLIDWHEDNHKFIQLFVESLKQGGPNFIFKRLGLEMFSRFVYFDFWDKKQVPFFIPAPSRKKGEKDHAFQLANFLAFYFGGEIKNVLIRDKRRQAQKSKSRLKRAFTKMESEKTLPLDKVFVFVDDVLTTGATARAAFQALNRPKNYFIFSLAWRRPILKKDHDEDVF